MSPEDRDEESLREYLEGNSELSRQYRRESDEQPDARLDAHILAEARRAVASKRRTMHSPFARHWLVPTSLAAVLVLSVSVVLLMPDPALGPEPERDAQPEPAAATPATADSVRLPTQTRPATESKEDAAGEGADSVSPRESAVTNQDVEQAVGKASEKRKLEQKSTTGSATQSLPAAPATGRMFEEAASTAAPARVREFPPPQPTPTDVVRADPDAWLRFIENLLDERDREGARSNLRAFRARYPDFPLPSTLTSLAASLDAERP